MDKAKTGLAVGAACVAACIGASVLPAILGGAALGGLLGSMGAEAAVLAVIALAGGAAWLWTRRRRAACECPPEGGCNTGDSCDLPRLKG